MKIKINKYSKIDKYKLKIKWIKETKLLFLENMIIYTSLEKSTGKLLHLIREHGKIALHKINIQRYNCSILQQQRVIYIVKKKI